ncbi:acyltransferase family protein [Ideonella sp.]|uniref:acyltransferase family protein n=1 Tax=Ideonella sp. TaxID=1929293 RepID=UPI003BB597F4
MNRRPDLDAARGIGMLLVIIGHATPPATLQTWIYGFHMPLFFVISGLLWRGQVRLAHSARALLLPFLIASLVSWGLWLAKQQLHRPDPVPWWGPLLATVYGGDLHGYLVHNTPLWFLPAMFSMLLGLWLAGRWLTSSGAVAALAAAGLLVAFWPQISASPASPAWPASAAQGLIGAVFFAAGFALQHSPQPRARRWIWLPAALAVYSLLTLSNGRVDLFSMQLQQPALYLAAGLVGSWWLITACQWPWLQHPLLLRLGRHSLLILAAHLPLLWILRALAQRLHVPATWYLLTAFCAGAALVATGWLERRSQGADTTEAGGRTAR